MPAAKATRRIARGHCTVRDARQFPETLPINPLARERAQPRRPPDRAARRSGEATPWAAVLSSMATISSSSAQKGQLLDIGLGHTPAGVLGQMGSSGLSKRDLGHPAPP